MGSEPEQHEREAARQEEDPSPKQSGMTPRGKYTIIIIGVAFFGILMCMCLSIFALVAV